MKKLHSLSLALLALAACTGSGNGDSNGDNSANDSTAIMREDHELLPDTAFASAAMVSYNVELCDSTDGTIVDVQNPYDTVPGWFTFRGSSRRDVPQAGKVSGTPTTIVEDWKFVTHFDNTETKLGVWGGGTGWTGQPLYVNWGDDGAARVKAHAQGLTADFGKEEIMVGSLCGKVYFLNFENGKISREPIDVGNPIKGTISLDPDRTSLYVGQGVPAREPFGHMAIDLDEHKVNFFFGRDPKAKRNWGAYDSSPAVAGDFLFWPGENGTLYKYRRLRHGNLKLHSAMRYTIGGVAPGAESSLCIYKNYGYFGDNHGHVLCVNLCTMKPVWHYDNHDDIDATVVLQVENGTPFIYAGCEVDRQGDCGSCHLVKLNGLNGELAWERTFDCKKLNLGGKHFDGGLYCTPLLGHGDCEGMLFANICQRGESTRGEFTALSTATGEILYATPLKYFSWTSPVPYYNENKELFVLTGDTSGNLYLIKGKTGEIITTIHGGNNFESSPVAVGNHAVVGSRGQEIYRFTIK